MMLEERIAWKLNKVTIYHNPRCRKSREGLKLLQDHGIEPKIIKYLEDPPSEQELDRLLRLMDMSPYDLLRKQEKEFKELNLKEQKENRQALIHAMVTHPRLIQRPIVVKGDQAVLGRPAENILDIL